MVVAVETTAIVVGCPDCGVRAIGHGRSTVQVRDLPNGSGPVRLVWRKRRWRCPDPDCERQTFTEQSELVEGSLTRRVRAEICRAVGERGHTVAEQSRRFGVGWATAMAAVRDHGRPLVEDRRMAPMSAISPSRRTAAPHGPRQQCLKAPRLSAVWHAQRRRFAWPSVAPSWCPMTAVKRWTPKTLALGLTNPLRSVTCTSALESRSRRSQRRRGERLHARRRGHYHHRRRRHVATGDNAIKYGFRGSNHLRLGDTVLCHGRRRHEERTGSV